MKMRKYSKSVLVLFFMTMIVPGNLFAQAAVPVITLADGTTVSMTSAQLTALTSQPGVALSSTPVVTATQMAVPLPASLGGGFMVAEPAALAAGMNTVGITSGATATGVLGASTTAGTITAGASAGAVASGGVTVGTVAAGAAAVAVTAAAIAEATKSTTTTTHH